MKSTLKLVLEIFLYIVLYIFTFVVTVLICASASPMNDDGTASIGLWAVLSIVFIPKAVVAAVVLLRLRMKKNKVEKAYSQLANSEKDYLQSSISSSDAKNIYNYTQMSKPSDNIISCQQAPVIHEESTLDKCTSINQPQNNAIKTAPIDPVEYEKQRRIDNSYRELLLCMKKLASSKDMADFFLYSDQNEQIIIQANSIIESDESPENNKLKGVVDMYRTNYQKYLCDAIQMQEKRVIERIYEIPALWQGKKYDLCQSFLREIDNYSLEGKLPEVSMNCARRSFCNIARAAGCSVIKNKSYEYMDNEQSDGDRLIFDMLVMEAGLYAQKAYLSSRIKEFLSYGNDVDKFLNQAIIMEDKFDLSERDKPSYLRAYFIENYQDNVRSAVKREVENTVSRVPFLNSESKQILFQDFKKSIDELASKGALDTSTLSIIENEYKTALSLGEKNMSSKEAAGLDDVDNMDGIEFEKYCVFILEKNGFKNIRLTKSSGDQGIDILATKDDIKYGFQCKCYSSDLGNTPVQEAYSGKAIYNCNVVGVLTNRYFTTGAKELALKTGVFLWDRDKLKSLIESAEATEGSL